MHKHMTQRLTHAEAHDAEDGAGDHASQHPRRDEVIHGVAAQHPQRVGLLRDLQRGRCRQHPGVGGGGSSQAWGVGSSQGCDRSHAPLGRCLSPSAPQGVQKPSGSWRRASWRAQQQLSFQTLLARPQCGWHGTRSEKSQHGP